MRLTVLLGAVVLLLTPALAFAQEEEDRCEPRKSGEQCGEGNGRQTPGGQGTGKVSHKGWPKITGILWTVLDSASVKARNKFRQRSDRLSDGYNLSYTTGPETVASCAKRYDAVAAWVTIPLDTRKRTYSAYFGLVGALRSPRRIPMSVADTAKYECLALDVFHKDITPDLLNV